MFAYVEFEELVGKTLTKVVRNEFSGDGDAVYFYCDDGSVFKMYHRQDCCECVTLEDIDGDLDRLIGQKILVAEERTSQENPPDYVPEYQDSFTWSFYTIRTNLDSVTLRWCGESNGYYSEEVDFEIVSFPAVPILSDLNKERICVEIKSAIDRVIDRPEYFNRFNAERYPKSVDALAFVLHGYPDCYIPLVQEFVEKRFDNYRFEVISGGDWSGLRVGIWFKERRDEKEKE